MPSRIEGETPDAQVAFLTQVYPQVRERIQQRSFDPARQEALLTLAERLNPVMWTDADQITSGLQQAAEAFERLSHIFAKRRRRTRKKSKGTAASDAAGEAATPEAEELSPDVPGDTDSSDPTDTDESSSF